MTNLFLYSLGLVCLLIIGALFLDAYLAKRRMRQWYEWKQMDAAGDAAGFAGGTAARDLNAGVGRRRKKFMAGFGMVAVLLLLVAMHKRHAPVATELAVSNPSPQNQIPDAVDAAAFASDSQPMPLMRLPASALPDEDPSPRLPNIPEWMLGVQWMPESELDFATVFDLDPDVDFSGIEISWSDDAADAADAVDEISEESALAAVYDLDGALSLDARLQAANPAQILRR
jgi:hypothetical protein